MRTASWLKRTTLWLAEATLLNEKLTTSRKLIMKLDAASKEKGGGLED
jgi:hypothetical protein